MPRATWMLLVAAATVLAGCGKRDEAPAQAPPAVAPAPVASAAATEARSIYAARCASCHGATGKGDGAMAARLTPPPRDYTDAAWQQTVTDEDLAKIIVQGGGALGKSAMMPPGPDLRDKAEVVAELVAMVRGFAAR